MLIFILLSLKLNLNEIFFLKYKKIDLFNAIENLN